MVAIEQVQDCLIRSGLASETVVFGARREIEAAGEPVDGELLIRHLLGEGRLTPFQAKRIREGRGLELVIGNYFILSRIGAGGMGIVYKALHRRMQRVVALKLIRKQKQQIADFIERFQREVQAAARLNHPHVIAAYDADECELGHYLVMEYVEGADLKEVVAKSGPLSAAEAIDAICQAAEGLHYAHSQRIVHRDVKPANLMRDVHGVVKIADMGLARLESIGDEEALASLTSDGIAAGTVDYMSPEQSVDTSSVDNRADIYSLGCTLFYILTGQPVFQRPSLIERLMAHRQQPPPSLLDFNDDTPDGLDEVFQKMVAKDPADRYQSMAEVAGELAALQPSSSIAAAWDPERTSVLVVEPSKMLTAMIRRYLGEMNIGDMHLLSTGAAAINALETTPATVVLASMQLDDMTGLEFAQHVRDDLRWSRVSIVVMTSESSAAVAENVRRLAGVTLLDKPFSAEQLRGAILTAAQTNSIADAEIAGLDELQVLIVDDSSIARRHMRQVLTDLGFEQFTNAVDGLEAIAALDQQEFDLVVSDYNMPRWLQWRQHAGTDESNSAHPRQHPPRRNSRHDHRVGHRLENARPRGCPVVDQWHVGRPGVGHRQLPCHPGLDGRRDRRDRRGRRDRDDSCRPFVGTKSN